MTRILRNARLRDGRLVDVVIVGATIASVVDAATLEVPGAEVDDLGGMLLVPAATEPHAHLDKAFTADRVVNESGDLLGAIVAWSAYCTSVDPADTAQRAEQAALAALTRGITAMRTHVDVGDGLDLKSVMAVLEVRERLAGLMDLQIVPLVSAPTTGRAGAEQRARLVEAIDMGVDVVGGCPHLEDEPRAAIEFFVGLAAERGVLVDLHVDETQDPSVLTLRDVAHVVRDHDMAGRAAASHCVSLGVQPPEVQLEIAEQCALAGVSIVALPQTNLFLQSRAVSSNQLRGLTPIALLRAAGVNVAGGADNVQDPFNTMGRSDPMETAALLVMAGHLSPDDAYRLVSEDARTALAMPAVDVVEGSPAELLAISATNVREAIAFAPGSRRVYHAGRLVASSSETVRIHR